MSVCLKFYRVVWVLIIIISYCEKLLQFVLMFFVIINILEVLFLHALHNIIDLIINYIAVDDMQENTFG